jgi:hypothetical protein
VQDNSHFVELVLRRMLDDPPRSQCGRLCGQFRRAAPPALIRVLVDVAMIARQIAPAVNLQYELPKREKNAIHSARKMIDESVLPAFRY